MKSKESILTSILFLAIGLFVFLRPDALVKFISYFLGGVLIAYGLYKTLNYYIKDKRNGIVNQNEFGFGVSLVILGILFICLAGTIEFLLRIVIGTYLIIAGVTRIMNTFYTNDRGTIFYSLLIMGVLFIASGIYTITTANLTFKLLGLIMIIYGIMDLVGYFVTKDKVVKAKPKEVEEAELIEEKTNK